MKQIVKIFLILFLLIGCNDTNQPDNEAENTTIANIPTAAPTRAPEDVPNLESFSTNEAVPRFDLNIWLSDEIDTNMDSAQGQLLNSQFVEFNATHPDVQLHISQKTINDQGGSLSYLRTGRNVAPAILPDVIILPTNQLASAAAEGLIYPITELVDSSGLYPAALDLGTVGETLYGLPFILTDLYHLAYNSSVFTDTIPSDWSNLALLPDANLVLAAAGDDGAAFTLQTYIDANGQVATDSAAIFAEEPLANALSQIQLGVDTGLIVKESAEFTASAETWNFFRRGDANIAVVKSADFLLEQIEGTAIKFAPIPGNNGQMPPVVSGWAWAITTPDVARQAVSAELIAWLTNSQNLGSWSAAAGLLPARSIAFSQWQSDPYITFLQTQLQVAHALPAQLDSSVTNALTNAAVSLIKQPLSAEDAASQIIQTLQP